MYKCRFCGKTVGNFGCLKIHETACDENPDRKKCPNRKGNGGAEAGHINKYKGLTKDNCEDIRVWTEKLKEGYKSGKIRPSMLGKHHTDETKRKISDARKKWLRDNPERHPWKSNNKFISEPCENLKHILRSKGINFIEEYEPFDDYNYSIDIAFPDEKIGIEVNGEQHYDRSGNLEEYYQKRHNLFEERGWKLFEIHYSKCYNIKIDDFSDILSLPIYDKCYVEKYMSRKERVESKKNQIIATAEKKRNDREKEYLRRKDIIRRMLYESGIDFTHSGWNKKCRKYLEDRGELFDVKIFDVIRKYYPEFLKRDDVWKRKGSIY